MESSYYLSDLCLEPVCAPYSTEPYFYGQSFSAFPPFYTTDRRRPSFSFFNSSTSLLPNIDSFTSDYLHQRPSFSFPSSSTASSASSAVSSSATSASSSLAVPEPANAYFESIMPHLPHPPPLVHRSKAALPPVSLPTGPQLTLPPALPLPTHPVSNNNNVSSNKKAKTPKALKLHKTPKNSKKEQKKAEKHNTQPSTNGQADLPPIDVPSPSTNGSSENGRRPMLLKTDKKRVIWTKKLHGLFLQALEVLGHDAMPRSIWSYMEIPGLTRENVASHLQKYKIKLRRERALEEREEGILAEC